MENFRSGAVVGNGAAINIELGWIPDVVEVYNATDGTPTNKSWIGEYSIPFSSGGVNEIAVGDLITGATSGATARVKQVEVYSGTWAAGDAAGFFVVKGEDIVGTFASENVFGEAAGATNDATVTVQVVHGYDSDTELAADNAGIVPYVGVAGTNSKGFTIASGLATEAKLLRWTAQRNG